LGVEGEKTPKPYRNGDFENAFHTVYFMALKFLCQGVYFIKEPPLYLRIQKTS
jgi:hypothetical protein